MPKNNKRLQKVKPFNYNDVVNFLYKVENPFNKNVNGAYVTSFNDGWAPTIGPGVASTSGANPDWFNGKPVKKTDVDRYAFNHLVNDDKIIRKAYDKLYGTEKYPNPSDTLSVNPRMYVAQYRYQKGSLGDRTNAILNALAKGNSRLLKNAIAKNNKDIDRIRRVNEAMPIIYK